MRRVIALIVLAAAAGWGLAGDRLAELSRKADGYKGKHDFVYLYNDADVRVHANGMSHRVERSALKVLSTARRRSPDVELLLRSADHGHPRRPPRPGPTAPAAMPRRRVKSYPQPARRAIYWPNVRSDPVRPAGGGRHHQRRRRRVSSYALLAEALDDSLICAVHGRPFLRHCRDAGRPPGAEHPLRGGSPGGRADPVRLGRCQRHSLDSAARVTDHGMRYIVQPDDLAP